MIKQSKYRQIFLTDSKSYLKEMNNALLELEKDKQKHELINLLFRHIHSLKGMSATMGYSNIKELSHAMEDFLEKFRGQQDTLTPPSIDILFTGLDLLKNLIEEIDSGIPSEADYKILIQKMSLFDHLESSENTTVPENRITINQPRLTSIPVESQLLDNLLNIVGEMTIQQSKLMGIDKSTPLLNVHEDLMQMGNLIKKLHSEVTHIRLMPLDTLTASFPRLVRELGKAVGKKIDFDVQGEDIKLDRLILEELWDPLIHLVRNAVDHGIEFPQTRLKRDKPPRGKVLLWTSREKEMVLIGLKDDGNGIDFEEIKKIAIEKGVLTPEKSNNIDHDDILAILTIPGFSTSPEPDEVSGRGVGLDLIKNRIETLGGKLTLFSTPQKGCNYVMKLPLNLAIYQAIFVRLNSQIFAIPLTKVIATVEKMGREINCTGQEKTFVFRNNQITLLDLKDSLGISPGGEKDRNSLVPIVITEIKNRNIGLMADELIGCHQIFVKPMGQPLGRMEIFPGTTIWGKGDVALVLDVEKLCC